MRLVDQGRESLAKLSLAVNLGTFSLNQESSCNLRGRAGMVLVPINTYLLGVDSHEIPKVVPTDKELGSFFKFLQVYSLTGQHPSTGIIEKLDRISIEI